jgi:hypothetical protein
MSVHALKPTFNDRESYLAWRNSWKTVYSYISADIRRRKLDLKAVQRAGADTAKTQRSLILQRADATKMMTLLKEAKLRRDRIREMRQSIADQIASFPLTIDARRADFHFNKGHIQFPTILPRWMLKVNGRSFYIEHLDAQMGFSTRELDEGSTLGMLRFRNCTINLDATNTATLTPKAEKLALVA